MTLVGTQNRCSIVPVHQRWLNSVRTIFVCTGALGLAFNFLAEKMAAILSINRYTVYSLIRSEVGCIVHTRKFTLLLITQLLDDCARRALLGGQANPVSTCCFSCVHCYEWCQ